MSTLEFDLNVFDFCYLYLGTVGLGRSGYLPLGTGHASAGCFHAAPWMGHAAASPLAPPLPAILWDTRLLGLTF